MTTCWHEYRHVGSVSESCYLHVKWMNVNRMDLAPSSRKKEVLLLILCLTCHWSMAKNNTIPRCKGKVYSSSARSSQNPNYAMDMVHNLKSLKIPKRFDSRERWPHCRSLKTILSQGQCGGCWAFSSASALSDRLCIATDGEFNQMLSTQDLLECCMECVDDTEEDRGGCEGGYLILAYDFPVLEGIVTNSCKPLYEGIPLGKPQKKCRQYCQNRQSYLSNKKFSVAYKKSGRDLRQIQAEIMLYGPVSASILTYDYFYNIDPGTILYYDPDMLKKNEKGGRHAIKVIGWDVVRSVPVWIIANSWGADWADNGFGYVRRGKNDFDIEKEENMVAGTMIDGSRLTTTTKPDGSTVSSGSWLTLFFLILFI